MPVERLRVRVSCLPLDPLTIGDGLILGTTPAGVLRDSDLLVTQYL